MDDYRSARMAMIDSQLRASGVMDRGLIKAMSELPRERFVADHRRAVAYVDDIQPLPQRRFLLSPSQFARMAQLGKIGIADRVLDVGAATGYSTSVLASIARAVVATEHVDELAQLAEGNLEQLGVENASMRLASIDDLGGDTFDVIIFEGALDAVPNEYFAHLNEGGRLVVPVLKRGVAMVGTYVKTGKDVMFTSAFDATMPRLRSDVLTDEFVF